MLLRRSQTSNSRRTDFKPGEEMERLTYLERGPGSRRRFRCAPTLVIWAAILFASLPGGSRRLSADTTDRGAFFAESPEPPGPPEIRDEHLFAQGRLTLPATTASTLADGRWSVRISGLWSNSFSWSQTTAGEHPSDRLYLVDGETATADLTVARGMGDNFDLAIRLPWRWRGGGHLDGFIEWWHETFHLKTGLRDQFLRNEFRAEGRTSSGAHFSWDDDAGTGTGNAEMAARWRFLVEPEGWSLALVGRVGLPTAGGVFTPSTAAGLQLVATRVFAHPFSLDAGVGGTAESAGHISGVSYEPLRAHAFAAVAWRAMRALTLHLETDAATRLVSNIAHYPGTHWMVNATGAIRLAPDLRMELGLTENIISQGCTTDVAFYFALVRTRTDSPRR
jgi:hypothetical protein